MRDQGGALTASTQEARPSGNTPERRCVTKPSLHDNLMERVLEPGNLQRAWKRVKSKKGAPGIDGLPIEAFAAYAPNHWSDIRQALNDGRNRPQSVKRVTIP